MENISKRITFIREKYNMTKTRFANELGIDQGYVSHIEKGSRVPSKSLIKFICNKFRINEIWLLSGEGPMNLSPEEEINEALKFYNASDLLLAIHKSSKNKIKNSPTSELLDIPDISNKENIDLYNMMKWFMDTWESGDYKIKGWLAIQFEKAFPEYLESLEKKQRVAGESEVSGN